MSADLERELAELRQSVADLDAKLVARTAERDELFAQSLATSDVLKAISRSQFDLDSVMDTIARSAARLCRADLSAVSLRDGDMLTSRGAFHAEAKLAAFVKQTPIAIDDQSYIGRAVLTGTVQHIPDINGPVETSLTIAQVSPSVARAFLQKQANGQLRRSQLTSFVERVAGQGTSVIMSLPTVSPDG